MAVNTEHSHDQRGAPDDAGDLVEQLRILLDYKWTIIGITLAAILAAAAVVYFWLDTTYRGTATLKIEADQSNILNANNIYGSGPQASGFTYFTTQYEVLHSRELAQKALERIDWSKYPEFVPDQEEQRGWLDWALGWVTFADADPAAASPEANNAQGDIDAERQRKLVDVFREAIRIQPVSSTLLVNVHFVSENPQLAKEAANALTDVYIESGFEAKLDTARRTTDWMKRRLESLRAELEKSEAALQDFRDENNLVDLGAGQGNPLLAEELSDYRQKLRAARQAKAELENTYREIQQANGQLQQLQAIGALRNQASVQSAQKTYVQAQETLDNLQPRYGSKHPRITSAEANLEEARANYLEQLRSAADSIRSQYQIAAQNVASLEREANSARDQIRGLNRKQARLDVLEREAQTNQQLYNKMLNRFKEADIEGQFQSLRAQVVDPAILPTKPFKPSKTRWLGLAGGAGLVFAVCLVWLREKLDESIHSSDEFEQVTGISVLASAPIAQSVKRGKAVAQRLINEPQSLFAEAIRTARTGIFLSDVDKTKKRLMVTSALPQEGKSCIASNLAMAFGQMEKVLLIEADLRRPALARYLGLERKAPGLTELIGGEVDREQAVHRVADCIDFLPVGKIPPNPAELLSTDRFREVIDMLAADYDRVIFDSSPCQPVSDSMLLARHTDAAILVLEAEATGRAALRSTLKHLKQARVPVIGAILNRYDHARRNRYGEYYYYGT